MMGNESPRPIRDADPATGPSGKAMFLMDGTARVVLEKALAEKLSDKVVLATLDPTKATPQERLDDVVREAEAGKTVLMMAFLSQSELAKDPRFHVALSYPNVRFERLPVSLGQIEQTIAGIEHGSDVRPPDLLVRSVYALPQMKPNELSVIRHDLGHAQSASEGSDRQREMDARWIPRARTLFGNLNREALIAAVRRAEQPTAEDAPLAGETFENVCCDVEGTLLRSDGSLDEAMLTKLQQEATQRPVTLWTGGDLAAIDKRLRQLGVTFPVVPKAILRGATVAVAIDDEPYDAFSAIYGVQVRDYRQVPSDSL